jgi:Na+-transporting methylmalonyl-CoA/oxaloacetate decarboxylase gamma subunit
MSGISILLFATGGGVAGHISFGQNAAYQTVGMAVVLGTLGALALLISVGSRLVRLIVPEAPPAVAPVAAVVAATHQQADALEEARFRVVVAAAVAAVLPQAHRVVSVVHIDANSSDPQWGREGRRQIFQGRQVR